MDVTGDAQVRLVFFNKLTHRHTPDRYTIGEAIELGAVGRRMTDHKLERRIGDSRVGLCQHGAELLVLIFERGMKGRNVRAATAKESELSNPPTLPVKSNIFFPEKADHFGTVEVAWKSKDCCAIASRRSEDSGGISDSAKIRQIAREDQQIGSG